MWATPPGNYESVRRREMGLNLLHEMFVSFDEDILENLLLKVRWRRPLHQLQ